MVITIIIIGVFAIVSMGTFVLFVAHAAERAAVWTFGILFLFVVTLFVLALCK